MEFKVELKTSGYDRIEFVFSKANDALKFMQSAVESFHNRNDEDRVLSATLTVKMSTEEEEEKKEEEE